jgi:hypothetical protein
MGGGTVGMTKTLMLTTSSSTVTVNIGYAGWQAAGAGVITLSSIGSACTLQWVNSKWYCVGNNGAVFS